MTIDERIITAAQWVSVVLIVPSAAFVGRLAGRVQKLEERQLTDREDIIRNSEEIKGVSANLTAGFEKTNDKLNEIALAVARVEERIKK